MNKTAKVRKILFIGVEDIEQTIVQAFLNEHGNSYFASSIEQAKQLFDEHQPDITICEAETRGLDIRKICSDLSRKPCIFLSSRDRDIERRKSLLTISDCYLTRPYTPKDLINAVSKAQQAPVLGAVVHG